MDFRTHYRRELNHLVAVFNNNKTLCLVMIADFIANLLLFLNDIFWKSAVTHMHHHNVKPLTFFYNFRSIEEYHALQYYVNANVIL